MTIKKVLRTTNTKTVVQPSNTANYLSGPKGDTGATGATGATGPQGPQGIPGAINSDITAIETVTQAEYDALTPNPNTLYIIVN